MSKTPHQSFKNRVHNAQIKLLRHLNGHHDFVKFIILTRSRTGSNLLVSYLKANQNVLIQNEIMNRLNGRSHTDILNPIFGKQPRFIKAAGYKMFYYHPIDAPDCPIWDEFEQMSDLHIIHLKRKNILRTLISRQVAGINETWHAKDKKDVSAKPIGPLTISADELRQGFEETRAMEIEADERFKHHPKLNLYYEDLIYAPAQAFQTATSFLDLQYTPPVTSLKKQANKPLSQRLQNYDELKAAFANTEWASFFVEEPVSQ